MAGVLHFLVSGCCHLSMGLLRRPCPRALPCSHAVGVSATAASCSGSTRAGRPSSRAACGLSVAPRAIAYWPAGRSGAHG